MILQTRRLIIRKFKPIDLASLIDMFTDPEVMRYIGPRRPMTEDEIQNWLADILHRQESELTRYAVVLKAIDELLGVAGLQDDDGVKDFGYYFRRLYWRKGYAQEACSVIIDHIETSLQIRDYQILIADENTSSIRMIKKLDMQATKVVTKSGERGHLHNRIYWLK
ncbi:MAG TPA: GNAT family N-acetyltransferase [Anaerolineales bacterium]|nr:GNAT family N-acetyltransferase [Anaerolineales bacterium]